MKKLILPMTLLLLVSCGKSKNEEFTITPTEKRVDQYSQCEKDLFFKLRFPGIYKYKGLESNFSEFKSGRYELKKVVLGNRLDYMDTLILETEHAKRELNVKCGDGFGQIEDGKYQLKTNWYGSLSAKTNDSFEFYIEKDQYGFVDKKLSWIKGSGLIHEYSSKWKEGKVEDYHTTHYTDNPLITLEDVEGAMLENAQIFRDGDKLIIFVTKKKENLEIFSYYHYELDK